jgi:2-amino-4-hydroxy-6-hydroxymethyldihydropteridine diphosphokinase
MNTPVARCGVSDTFRIKGGMVEKVFLGLGSNRGDSRAILGRACDRLGGLLSGMKQSGIYRTSPLYVTDQPDFLNMVVVGTTGLKPTELLEAVNAIEAGEGRDRAVERLKGERSLDIDILLYGDLTMATDRLVIPHRGMLERKFVLIPLLELEPSVVDPRTGLSFALALPALEGQGIYYDDGSAYNFVDSPEGGGHHA